MKYEGLIGNLYKRKEVTIISERDVCPNIAQICDENEIMLIFDEVQAGICLLGKFWAH
ncbi:MAG: aminotransferase class III-fold pyridoxal phosphate-dependent enzyme [Bacteroidetes bacterium]|nr:aminotransferase class III-fold pyridoxal phosphate-dependent enzyme [Bacteroidota bacterium]